MTRRYYAPDLPATGGLVSLSDTESQHAIRVMRVQPGDGLTLFDGQGNQAEAIVESVSRKECLCLAEPAQAVDRESNTGLELAIALPKPDRAREMIERLTEIGVHAVTPLIAARSQRPPSPSQLEKLRRGVIEASKQCGRNVLMHIHPPVESTQYFADPSLESKQRYLAHPGGIALSQLATADNLPSVVAIGPEGGWDQGECEIAIDAGFQSIDLGKRILRIETAALVVATVRCL